ncbi:MAG: hypothetical protein V3V29_00930 [Acidimicrobiia bacterium]
MRRASVLTVAVVLIGVVAIPAASGIALAIAGIGVLTVLIWRLSTL